LSVTNIFDLNLNQQNNNENYYCFFVNQGDYATRTIQANLYITYTVGSTRIEYNLTDETVKVLYEYTNSSGIVTITTEDSCTKATSIGNNVVTFLLPDDVLDNYGDVTGQIKIYQDVADILNTASFRFRVNKSIISPV